MSARRQASTTSLSRYARANSPELAPRSDAFCNAFWGLGDGGVDVLFARMRGATRTIDELQVFFKERSAIEEEYAKRLAKLAKQTLGRDEIGELRNSLDTLRLETDKQAGFHTQLAQQIRTDILGQTSAFAARQAHFKKAYQSQIEKEFKAKQTQESYVNRAREKYESDCLRINSYTAQSTLVQGKDLEKIHLKLERAQQTVQANERDFANFARAFQETVAKWEQNWKTFCDSAQDLEEERMEFMKDNMWAYANSVSTVCVSDDESCERMRLALEQLEPDKDMENFVRDYGTGNSIPDPPAFVNYTTPDAVSSASTRPTTHPAMFSRVSQRPAPLRAPPPQTQEVEPEPPVNTAGVGAGNRRPTNGDEGGLTRQPTRGSTRGGGSYQASSQANGSISMSNGAASSGSRQGTPSRDIQGSYRPPQDPNAEPIDPTAKTMIKIGEKAYEVDPNNDPQQQSSSRTGGSVRRNGTLSHGRVGEQGDPLAQTMQELNAGSGSSATKRNSIYRPAQTQPGPSRKGTMDSVGPGSSSLSPPGSSSSVAQGSSNNRNTDYRNSAEVVVGAYPGTSRPSSPNPPKANFFPGQKPVSPSNSGMPVETVLNDYHQSFPGEGKSPSRRNSFNAPPPPSSGPSGSTHSRNQSRNQSQGQNFVRPVSREGHAGIGAGRGTSPQPISRNPSPGIPPGGAGLRNSGMNVPPTSASALATGASGGFNLGRSGSIAQRATSPNSVGIALDPNGRVAVDEMADRYRQQPPQQQPYQQGPHRQTSYTAGGSAIVAPPPQQPNYGYGTSPAPRAPGYPAQQPYTPHPSAPQQQPYNPPPPAHYNPPPSAQPVYQPQPQAYPNGNGVQRGASVGGGGSGSYNYGQSQPSARTVNGQYSSQGYRETSPAVVRTPSPQPAPQQGPPPTNQYTEDGRGILFYVKALYDYTASIEEEFDFQSGDIIAVTATPEDGWWSGELLDESRRQPGRHVFPSNFVCLF
ncbi:hypothetical protein PLICRDRAFT_48462 [Plicaturopsis crispa FD-325 SS-3]|nr:hypothetical protein PLICRDRAFT_48462 [Plicaturopsis crispa FD-325 SS-3]